MKKNIFRGSGVALATPFDEDGCIDWLALRKMTRHVLAGGVDFICVLGTTAETPTLSKQEQERLRKVVVEEVGGRVPLLLGAGGNDTAEICRHLREENFEGYDGLLMVCPYYNKPSQRGLLAHFKALSEASRLPIVLYNIPGRTGVNLSSSTTLELARKCDNIVAIKEASGNVKQIEEIIAGAPKGFEVISGDDGLTLSLLRAGAVGVISVINNAFPAVFSGLVHSALSGDEEKANGVQERLKPVYELLSVEGNPSGLKALLSVLGLAKNIVRLPLVSVSERTLEALKAYCEKENWK